MYIKPSNPIPRADMTGKSLGVNRKTESGAESFKDLLEEIDIVELSTEIDKDERKKKDLQKKKEESKINEVSEESSEVAERLSDESIKGINRFA